MSDAIVKDVQDYLGSQLSVIEKSIAGGGALLAYNQVFKSQQDTFRDSLMDAGILAATSTATLSLTGPVADAIASVLPEFIIQFGDKIDADIPENIIAAIAYSLVSRQFGTSIADDGTSSGYLKTFMLGFATLSSGEMLVTKFK